MMTVGQHDSAWLNVMGTQIPNATGYLRQILIEDKYQTHIELMKVARENLDILDITEKEWAEDYKKLMKEIGYSYKAWSEES